MTIEIADRLVKLRKKYGYSQEELADKLGLSRQAVSKWERAEASPDTDNLICLAKLYGVSLDELLATDEDVDTIVKEQIKEEAEEKENNDKKDKHDKVVINNDGIYVQDADGSQVIIGKKGVQCFDEDGTLVVNHKEHKRALAVVGCIEGALFLLAAAGYMLLGFLCGLWSSGWILFFVPEIICSLARAIIKKNANNFNMAFTCCFAFFFVCMMLPDIIGIDAYWHIMWVVFLMIPIYHTTVSAINKAIGKEKIDEDDEEDKEEDND